MKTITHSIRASMRTTCASKMKQFIQLVPIMLFMAFTVAAAEDMEAEPTMETLVDRSYWAIQRMTNDHIKMEKLLKVAHRTAKIDEQLDVLRKSTREEEAHLKKLITKLEVGRSIFSYPGLIQLGDIDYISSKDSAKSSRRTYRLEFLARIGSDADGGSEPRYYQVRFDGKGMILSHVWLGGALH